MFAGSQATIYVGDLDRAVKFYTQTLDMKLMFQAGPKFAQLEAPGGMQIGLHPAGPKSPRPGVPGSIQVGIMCQQPIDQVVATLTQRGVRFQGPVVADPPVRLAFFGDPDGNPLYLCEYKP
ncbi:MAG: VOC family protein [Phycisphaerae bacterium]